MTEVCITGWAHGLFGKWEALDIESLIGQVAEPAISDAGLMPGAIDGVFVGHFNNGFAKQDFAASLAMQTLPELRFKPAMRVENACASGSAAIYSAVDFIRSGRGRTALVVGVEKMSSSTPSAIAESLLGASYQREEAHIPAGFAGLFGHIAQRYFELHGDQSDALAFIAAKNHRNGVDNPYAQLRKDLGFDFCRTLSDRNPYIAQPLKRTDCAPVSDGAAALVLTDMKIAAGMPKAVRFRATAHSNDYLPMSRRDVTRFEAGEKAWQIAYKAAGLRIQDLSFVETHDCFTIAELIEYETMGLVPRGQGARAALEGWTMSGGKLPINRSGGLKSKGHPVGATGVSMHIMAAMQLTGLAGKMQLPRAHVGAVYNMGGTAVANYVSILEPFRAT